MVSLFQHQEQALAETEGMTHVAYYHDMGLGKTFTGAEKMLRLGARVNLVVCQKSKVDDWYNHFVDNYKECAVFDLTNKADYATFGAKLKRLSITLRCSFSSKISCPPVGKSGPFTNS